MPLNALLSRQLLPWISILGSTEINVNKICSLQALKTLFMSVLVQIPFKLENFLRERKSCRAPQVCTTDKKRCYVLQYLLCFTHRCFTFPSRGSIFLVKSFLLVSSYLKRQPSVKLCGANVFRNTPFFSTIPLLLDFQPSIFRSKLTWCLKKYASAGPHFFGRGPMFWSRTKFLFAASFFWGNPRSKKFLIQ